MKYFVWIGELRVEADSVAAIKELAVGFGYLSPNGNQPSAAPPVGDASRQLLEAFCEGLGAVPAKLVTATLKTSGRGIPMGMDRWAKDVGVWQRDSASTWKNYTKGRKRLYSLTPDAKRKGRELLSA